jgi:hypothetical protein
MGGAFALAIAGAVIWLAGVNPLSLAFLLFFVVLPVANALLDWPSWAISRWLGHDLHDLMSGRSRWLGRILRPLFRGAWQAASFAVHILLDLGAAVVLLVALAILLPFLIQLFNNAVLATGGEPPLALHGFLTRAVQRPWPDGAWALAMLLTTLIPTALHAGAAIAMLLLLPLQPAGWRTRLADGLAAADQDARAWAVARASWLVVLTPLVAGVLVIGLGYGLVRLLAAVWRPVAELLLEAALFGMAVADHLADALGWLPAPPGT